MSGTKPDSPGVRFPPPLVYVIPFFAAFLLERRLPFFIVGDDDAPMPMRVAGLALMVIGFVLTYWAMFGFLRARTTPLPFRSSKALVVVAPYTFTRNPMYVGGTIAYVGGALVTNWAWPLVFLPVVVGVVGGYIIPREERYLHGAFGAQYDDYCARVRRWI